MKRPLLAAWLLLPSMVRASSPLEIPAWADLELRAPGAVELGRASTFEVVLTARVGETVVRVPTATPGPGWTLLAGPQPRSAQTVKAGGTVRWSFRARLDRLEAAPSRMGITVPARRPTAALEAEARRRYATVAARSDLEALCERIRTLPPETELAAWDHPPVTADEGVVPGRPPAWTLYLATPVGSFAAWDPPREPGRGAPEEALANASPALRKLLLAAGVPSSPSPGSRYLELRDELEAGLARTPPDPTSLSTLAARLVRAGAEAAPDLVPAFRNLVAVLRAVQGHTREAGQIWQELAEGEPLGHYALFNRAELLARSGDPAGARIGFEAALARRPVFTRARRRLTEIGRP